MAGKFPWPVPHYLALAPLDTFLRILAVPGARIRPRYWPRIAFNLFLSAITTIITLPERLLFAPILHLLGSRRGWQMNTPALVILGHFRSGTTHLHYLLSCDPRAHPRWYQCLVPHGGPLSWLFCRLFMIPFMSDTRPIDNVAYGPEWPAEDDFANHLWSNTSVQTGRMLYTNETSSRWTRRFLTLEDPAAAAAWRRTLWKFLFKISLFSKQKRLLLKSPPHTAHVRQVLNLLTHRDVKFIFLSREPAATIRSNVEILKRIRHFQFEDLPADEVLHERMRTDYITCMEAYLAQRGEIPPGNLTEMRFEDLQADPLAALRKAYADLDLRVTPRFLATVTRYLARSREYTPQTKHAAITDLDPTLAALARTFGHDRPPLPKAVLPEISHTPSAREVFLRLLPVLLLPIAIATAWAEWSAQTQLRQEWMVWPTGIVIGWSFLWAVRRGTVRLGLLAAAATAGVWAAVSFLNTVNISYAVNPHPELPVSLRDELIPQTLKQIVKPRLLLWGGVGLLTAYRFASRKQVAPWIT